MDGPRRTIGPAVVPQGKRNGRRKTVNRIASALRFQPQTLECKMP